MVHVPLNGGKSGMNEIAFDSIRAEWTSNVGEGRKTQIHCGTLQRETYR